MSFFWLFLLPNLLPFPLQVRAQFYHLAMLNGKVIDPKTKFNTDRILYDEYCFSWNIKQRYCL
jgi:hypothetical protein